MSYELAKIEWHDFGGAPMCEHNFPCPVCHKRHAVYQLSAGYVDSGTFWPCWECQNKGWELVKRRKPWWVDVLNKLAGRTP